MLKTHFILLIDGNPEKQMKPSLILCRANTPVLYLMFSLIQPETKLQTELNHKHIHCIHEFNTRTTFALFHSRQKAPCNPAGIQGLLGIFV
jgi:hypothetical protein